MFDQTVNGMVKTFLGTQPGQYQVRTAYSRLHGVWLLRAENSKGNWEEAKFPSEYEADTAANELCVRISRGDYVI